MRCSLAMRHYRTPSRMAHVQNPNLTIADKDVEQRNSHSLLAGLQNHTALLKESWEVSYKTEYSIPFLYNPGILIGIHQKELGIYVHTQMLKAAVFIVSKTWKQPRCLSVGEWISKWWFIQIMKYSALKRHEQNGRKKEMRH